MDSHDLPGLLESLLSLRREAEWVEFKLNKAIAREIGEYLSAVSNSAALHHKDHGYIVWGIEDQSLRVLGTTFRPRRTKVGNEELESWLSHQLEPRVHFVVHEFEYHGRPVVIFQVQACPNRPVGFRGVEYIRVGSYKKPLKEHPEKERLLWLRGPIIPFEKGVAASGASDDDVLSLLDHVAFFEIGKLPLPGTKSGLLDRLARENLIIPARAPKRWDITNLGAILFGKRLGEFESVARKAVRLIVREPRSNSHLEGTCLVAGLRSGFRRLDRLF